MQASSNLRTTTLPLPLHAGVSDSATTMGPTVGLSMAAVVGVVYLFRAGKRMISYF